jgi:perosamine synthetase
MQKSGNESSPITVPLCKPEVGEEELQAIRAVFATGNLSHGPDVTAFENAFAKKIGVKHAIALNSCTSGLFLLGQYIRETFGDGEVIVPSMTFVASANSIAAAGMTPRFAEVDWNTGEVTAEILEPLISTRTKALMVVHYAGRPCQMTQIMRLANKHQLFVIEDSAECIGATVDGKQAGSFATGVFSFYSTKNFTTGEGGMITTNDSALTEWLRTYLAHGVKKGSYSRDGVSQKWFRNAIVPGHNFRLSNFQAAMGLVQLEKLEKFNACRHRVANSYDRELRGLPNLELPELLPVGQHSYQMYPVKVPAAIRDRTLAYLNDHGVGASVHFDPPVHWQTAYKKEGFSLPVTEKLALSTITLPISSTQTAEQTDHVIATLKRALNL